jgi:asparaginyl-tRNA synthetase
MTTSHPITDIRNLKSRIDQGVSLQGWVYNKRESGGLLFLIMRDGTGMVQCVISQADVSEKAFADASSLTQESSLILQGRVKADERGIGGVEIHVEDVQLIQVAKDYPITPKEHGVEFLMDQRHLWLRSSRQWAAMQIRNTIIFAIHSFFQERGFVQMDAPIFTGNAVEGTTTLFETDYFDKKAYLSQSGQLYGEALAMAHGRIYTFGPTFRAEKSKTRRHLTEFWMIEPEMAFYDLNMNMDLAEDMLVYIVQTVLKKNQSELALLERDLSKLEQIQKPFPRISYTEAIELLKSDQMMQMLERMVEERNQELAQLHEEIQAITAEHGSAKKGRKFQIEKRQKDIKLRIEEIEEDLRNIPVWRSSAQTKQWGDDFGGSDETLLTMCYDRPLMVYNYPAEIKAFYMKKDPNNPKEALAVDVLAPEGYGEIIGGAQREDNLDELLRMIKLHELPEEAFDWYLDLRKFGSVPHAGFGLGLERTVAWVCGLKHVRETIPFPRLLGRLYP